MPPLGSSGGMIVDFPPNRFERIEHLRPVKRLGQELFGTRAHGAQNGIGRAIVRCHYQTNAGQFEFDLLSDSKGPLGVLVEIDDGNDRSALVAQSLKGFSVGIRPPFERKRRVLVELLLQGGEREAIFANETNRDLHSRCLRSGIGNVLPSIKLHESTALRESSRLAKSVFAPLTVPALALDGCPGHRTFQEMEGAVSP